MSLTCDHEHDPTTPLWRELVDHLPFTLGAALAALGIAHLLIAHESAPLRGDLFHLAHPAHMILSAAATVAVFLRRSARRTSALLVGFLSALVLCSVSDVAIPWLGGTLIEADFPWHLCLVEEPWLVAPSAALGAVLGLLAAQAVRTSSFFSHSGHVLVSTLASMLYLAAHTSGTVFSQVHVVAPILALAVLAPCCLSDIVAPVLLARPRQAHHGGQTPP